MRCSKLIAINFMSDYQTSIPFKTDYGLGYILGDWFARQDNANGWPLRNLVFFRVKVCLDLLLLFIDERAGERDFRLMDRIQIIWSQ